RDNDYSDNRLGFNETTGHFHHGGGLNLRGYSGYLAPETRDSSEQVYTYRGLSGAAVNAELELSRLVTLMPKRFRQTLKMDAYLFGDAGMINMNDAGDDPVMACIRADAGAGIAITVKKWGKLEQAAPLTVRFDMPLFLSRPPYLQEYFEFRWMVGVSRAF
ncbi:MAG: hypothetical protein KJ607_12055, partial [Bacteroidetes bacterium]|nr:hypothetical protein [Bacteroidota bacterium]